MNRDAGSGTWDEALARLRGAGAELAAAASRTDDLGADNAAAKSQLQQDVSRLEHAASTLLAKLQGELDAKRAGIEASFDKERAERSTGQLKASLEELADLTTNVARNLAAETAGSLRQAEPELNSVTHALDDVVSSAATWVRATLDPERDRMRSASEGRPPLDDL